MCEDCSVCYIQSLFGVLIYTHTCMHAYMCVSTGISVLLAAARFAAVPMAGVKALLPKSQQSSHHVLGVLFGRICVKLPGLFHLLLAVMMVQGSN